MSAEQALGASGWLGWAPRPHSVDSPADRLPASAENLSNPPLQLSLPEGAQALPGKTGCPSSVGAPTHRVAPSEHKCAEQGGCSPCAATAPAGRPGTRWRGFKRPHCSPAWAWLAD